MQALPDGEADILAISNEGRVALIPAEEIPELAKGKGSQTLAIAKKTYDADGIRLAHILAVPRGRDITLHSGKQKLTIRANEREHYLTPRGHKGNWLPKNYRRIDHIELPAENPTPS